MSQPISVQDILYHKKSSAPLIRHSVLFCVPFLRYNLQDPKIFLIFALSKVKGGLRFIGQTNG